jgi:hypothetical protein
VAFAGHCLTISVAARACPPFFPNSAAALGFGAVSVISPVAIFAAMMAAPITSGGLFSPRGPLGMLLTLRAIRRFRAALS